MSPRFGFSVLLCLIAKSPGRQILEGKREIKSSYPACLHHPSGVMPLREGSREQVKPPNIYTDA